MEQKENLSATNLELPKLSDGKKYVVCKGCKKTFWIWRCQAHRRKFCSHKCSLSYWQLGDRNNNWKGGRKIDGDGYILIRVENHPFKRKDGYVFEHRLVVEKFVGRYLTPDEVIHHLDGNKANNKIDNLKIMTIHDHLSFENKKEKNPMYGKTPWNKKK